MCVEIGVWTLLALCLSTHHKSNVTSGRMPPLHGRKKNQFAKKHSPKEQLCDLNEVTKRQSTKKVYTHFFQPRFQGVSSFQHPERGGRKEKPLKRYWNETKLSFFYVKLEDLR